MKTRDLINLLHRAAAVIEHPESETEEERLALTEDLILAAEDLNS